MALNTKKHLLHLFLFILISAEATSEPKPECTSKCGSLSIPYPFGTSKGCYLDDSFFIKCSHSTPFLGQRVEVLNISLNGELHVSGPVMRKCRRKDLYSDVLAIGVRFSYFSVSPRNKFIAIGCDIVGQFVGYDSQKKKYTKAGVCEPSCSRPEDMGINGSCSGTGFCQTSIPTGLSGFLVQASYFKDSSVGILLESFNSDSNRFFVIRSFDPCGCGYAFIVEEDYNIKTADIINTFNNESTVPVVLDWAVGNHTCQEAKLNSTSYACRAENSECNNSPTGVGYLCKCLSGKGNPYVARGCEAIERDGMRNGTNLHPKGKSREILILAIALSVSSTLLVLLVGSLYLYSTSRKRNLIKIRENYFQQNGGILLQQQIARHKGSAKQATIFTAQELKIATDNYAEVRIVGKGGHGTVYKGVLSDGRVVAIKKSRISNQSEIEQFINEVVVLSQINHRNVVKLLGCCLETEVPLLVYEFIANGTLSDHIHVEGQACKLPWPIRLRVAAETAEVLAYLHSAASTPIIHRDVKTANILLDHNLTAKVSDFGASKLVPLDQNQLTTLVQGTLGYLDPEYFQTSQLTEKSDVYSFGVVLAELLTSKKALSFVKPESERNLSMNFVSSMREGRLPQILDEDMVNDANLEQITEVAILAKRCLMLKGEERPTMKEVAKELERLRIMVSGGEIECLLPVLAPRSTVNSGDTSGIISGFHSMQNEILESLGDGR